MVPAFLPEGTTKVCATVGAGGELLVKRSMVQGAAPRIPARMTNSTLLTKVSAAGVLSKVVYGGTDFSQTATPSWWEQVPRRCCENEYVPSLHRAVAPAGALLEDDEAGGGDGLLDTGP